MIADTFCPIFTIIITAFSVFYTTKENILGFAHTKASLPRPPLLQSILVLLKTGAPMFLVLSLVSNNSTHNISSISRINAVIKFMKKITDKKSDSIPSVIILWLKQTVKNA